MPKKIIPLTDKKIKMAKPLDRPYKLFDGDGLFLLVHSTGGKSWRFKYRFDGNEKMISFGSYPEISLAEARERRQEARKKIEHGIDLCDEKKTAQAEAAAQVENLFKTVAIEWHNKCFDTWTPDHATTILRRLERDVFPLIGEKNIDSIKPSDIIELLQVIESRGAIETAHRIKIVCGQVFRYGKACSKTTNNPVIDIDGFLKPAKKVHRAAITDKKEVGGLLRSIDAYEGTFTVKCALQLAPLVFVRPGELRNAEWLEIDLDAALWTIPAEKMKMRNSHIVPLSHQAIDILKTVHPFTKNSRYVFPSARSNDRPMSNNAILSALRRMGYEKDEMSGHGFRAMARTILDEELNVRPDYIEHQLAHAVRDPNGRAYNRTSHLEERKKMMQTWADYLDKLKSVGKVIPFQKSGTDG